MENSSDKLAGTQAGMSILLVEDHEDTLRWMVRLLNLSGHRVTTATSLASARSAAEAESFEVVISDLGLPDGSGLELIQQLLARNPGTKGIALTGSADHASAEECLRAGFLKHITKPVDIAALEKVLEQIR